MNKTACLVASAIGAALAGGATLAQAQSGGTHVPPPAFQAEKCYGVAKAGQNDCQTRTSSCAGTSRRDGQGDAWIYVPAGSCDRIVGGSLGIRQG
jgi:uncharacterized membrane protein